MASFPHLTQMERGLASGASHGTPTSFFFCHGAAATADSASLEISSGVLDTSPRGTSSDDKKACRKHKEDSGASFSSARSKVVPVYPPRLLLVHVRIEQCFIALFSILVKKKLHNL
jgi:hypothetical protein